MKISLIVVLISLVSADLITGIFYWNREYLSFDTSTFNNLFSPVASICASIIYGATLYFIIKQTKIFRSQSIKPHFENEIQVLKEKYDKIELFAYSNGKAQLLKPNSIIDEVSNSINLLMLNLDFLNLQSAIKSKIKVSATQIEDGSFFNDLYLLLGLTKPSNNYELFYNKVFAFVNEVELSTMTIEDKTFIVRKVISAFFTADLFLLNNFTNRLQIDLIIPLLYTGDDDSVGFAKFSDTTFFNNLVRVKNVLKKYTPDPKV
jgi:hypothetical protein